MNIKIGIGIVVSFLAITSFSNAESLVTCESVDRLNKANAVLKKLFNEDIDKQTKLIISPFCKVTAIDNIMLAKNGVYGSHLFIKDGKESYKQKIFKSNKDIMKCLLPMYIKKGNSLKGGCIITNISKDNILSVKYKPVSNDLSTIPSDDSAEKKQTLPDGTIRDVPDSGIDILSAPERAIGPSIEITEEIKNRKPRNIIYRPAKSVRDSNRCVEKNTEACKRRENKLTGENDE
ncbi:MAG TPA: hypothetical protein ENJ51_12305 [Leucothrix mucor]|uniref:Uncharacterized protein n=1 Tax=Leucothrix mucor TaxID=45248 RepID=A0A7V2T1T5_LEUMU|nr:hypothetical protein [Leucothrix mucor]